LCPSLPLPRWPVWGWRRSWFFAAGSKCWILVRASAHAGALRSLSDVLPG
jgi:hypothetical protein